VKPFVISEYGGRVLGSEHLPWSPYRDWMNLKSYTSMLLSFMDRPQHIVSAIPFITLKAEWGTQSNGNPYPWRMMRKDNELAGQTGNYWVFTELIKFYQMLKEVKGTRVDTNTSDPDIQTNAFVNGNKLYLIVNNLYFNDATVHLNMIENNGNAIQNINVKHLHLNATGDAPLLDDNNYTTLDSVVIGLEGAMVIEYTFQNNVIIDELVDETKYYADQHLTAIIPYANHTFNINGVTKGNGGEAILRLGLGRDHGLTLQPTVKINGYIIEVPIDHKGYDQLNKDSWFGVIEIPVPYYYIQADNEITVKFNEAGGHISSMALQVYNHSNSIHRSDSVHVSALTIAPSTKDLAIGTSYQLTPTITPIAATDHTLIWTSSDNNIATVDDLGNVSTIALGTVTITATTVDGGLTANSIINVLNTVPSVLVNNLTLFPETFTLEPGQFVQLSTTLSPIDADDKTITWTTSAPNIISISNTGMVQGQFEGTVEVIATTNDGSNLSDTSTITVQTAYSTFIKCFFLPSMLNQDTVFNISADYSTGYPANIIVELHDANNNIVASGQSFVPAGIGSTTVQVSASTAPAVGTDYSLHAFIENAIADSIVADCEKTNVEVTFAVSTFSVELTGIQLFPNPSQGELALEVPYLKDEMTVTVFDMMGRMIKQQTIHQTVNRIDLKGVASGMYLIQIKNDEASRTERIIIR
jgi:agarase